MQHAMWCSTAGGGSGSVYDVLGFAHPFLVVPHNGLPWSSPYQDSDTMLNVNCAGTLGGSWWYSKCSLISPTTASPMWFSLADSTFHPIKKCHLMVKPQ